MPNIFDNIELYLIEGLRRVLPSAQAASFCIGYLNLRGFGEIADMIEGLQGGDEEHACRLLVGMYRPPEEQMKALSGLQRHSEALDGPTVARLKRKITEGFKEQLEFGVPSIQAERTLRRLAAQLRARKVILKAFLRYPLHAKLYLVRRDDPATPFIGFVGSSNLTLAGLGQQGELNVDVVEQDAASKLQAWFDERWRDPMAFDLTDDLAELIETSWVREELVRPYLVYLKIAYHLSEEAREGEREFRVPPIFAEKGTPLLDFQEKAVSLAARHLHRHGGVLLGDVVGLGKTLMATAIARIFQEDSDVNTLVICPPKLLPMWDDYLQKYEINGRAISLGNVIEYLSRPEAPRYRLVVIDESHNLRNREGQRYQAIRDYIKNNDCRVLLLTATPYNKHFTDLSNQLRLFLDEDQALPVRPERFFQDWFASGKNESDFVSRYRTLPNSLRAFEQSPYSDDWRDLMRLFLVRRTRRFIMRNYAEFDESRGRYYVTLNGQACYFPKREPKTIAFQIRDNDPNDQYARLYSKNVVDVIGGLRLPRYGLAEYLVEGAERLASPDERRILENLNRAGRRLIGFCRTNLFKRLESSGHSFLLSVDRHILRNLVTLYAIENGLPVPIGTQDAAMMDTAIRDADDDLVSGDETDNSSLEGEAKENSTGQPPSPDLGSYRERAARVYERYRTHLQTRFDWLSPKFFERSLAEALEADARALLSILREAGTWDPSRDNKLATLAKLLKERHPTEKVLVFTQFADTAAYLKEQLQNRGIADVEVVTSGTSDPVSLARRFSPISNGGLRAGERELRILIATDVLAEGHNLQDAYIVVNYDLPWAIIRLIQRVGRVDRIGQRHDTILAYLFRPAEGVDRIITLRERLARRLRENQEVIGTDESFFGEQARVDLEELYTEKAGKLDDDEADEDIDLASLALQVWNSASKHDQKAAIGLPPMVSTTRALSDDADPAREPPGVIAYLRYPDNSDALVRVDEQGNLISQSLSYIFRAAACGPDAKALPRPENHYELVARCVEFATREQSPIGGSLGSLRSVRRKVWERLNDYRLRLQKARTASSEEVLRQLDLVLDLIWRYPLKRAAQDAIRRQLRLHITDEGLLELLVKRANEENLCEIADSEPANAEPRVICSIGLVRPSSAQGNPSI